MGRNLFDFNIANSSNKFLSGKVVPDGQDALRSLDTSLSSSTASSSVESFACSQSAIASATFATTDMEALNAMQRTRTAENSSRGDRKPVAFTNSSIMGSNMTNILTTGHQQHQSMSHLPTATVAAESKANKKCSVCGKSFNPLRRRHYCRTCTAVVCSSCSISRKVESTFEGAITVRMCVSCKLSSIASQDDFYDRIFSTNGGSLPVGTAGSQPSGSEGDFTTDRLSFASYSSGTGNGSNASKDDLAVGTTSSSVVDSQPPMDKRTVSSSNLSLRRKSSTTSGNQTLDPALNGRGRHGSLSGPLPVTEDCPWCMNEACAPLHEYFEVPYPFFLELADPAAKNQYIAAKHLDNEKERLRSVRTIRASLKAGTSASQTIIQLCSMAAIATSSPMALVGLLDKHVYVPCAETGLGSLDKIDRQKSLAAHACRNGSPLVCSDLTRDVRFAANPWRRDVLKAHFYAGIPLTLSNGHTIGAIEVFDVNPRFACMNVISQLQTVVRGLLRKFEDIIAKNSMGGDESGDTSSHKPSTGRRTAKTEAGESKQRSMRAPAPSAPGAPTIPPPKLPSNAPSRAPAGPVNTKPSGPAPIPPKAPGPKAPATTPPVPAPATTPPVPAPAATPPVPAPAATPVAPPVAPEPASVPAPAPIPATEASAPAAGNAEPSQNEMETRLMQLLSQTTSTQEQLRTQQGQMVSAISSHSKQISDLAKQLERMESTLAAKLAMEDDDSPSKGETDAASG